MPLITCLLAKRVRTFRILVCRHDSCQLRIEFLGEVQNLVRSGQRPEIVENGGSIKLYQ